MIIKLFYKLLIVLLCLTNGIIVAAEDNYQLYALAGFDPPNTYIDENGKPAGKAVQKVKKLLEQSKIKFKIDIVPWARAFRNATTRDDTVIFNIGRTVEREKLFHWIVPLSNFTDSLVSLNEKELILSL